LVIKIRQDIALNNRDSVGLNKDVAEDKLFEICEEDFFSNYCKYKNRICVLVIRTYHGSCFFFFEVIQATLFLPKNIKYYSSLNGAAVGVLLLNPDFFI